MSNPSLSTDTTHDAVHTLDSSPPEPKTRSRLRWWLGLGGLGLCLVVGVPVLQAQFAGNPSDTVVATANTPLEVETLTVEAVESYEVSRAYTGEIAAFRSSDLGFTRGGELVQVFVEDGDRVTTGQSLARLDTQSLETQKRQLIAQRAEAEARLLELERGARPEVIAVAEAEVRDVENQLLLQQEQRSRREFLYAQGAISREQLDEFAFGAETLAARLDSAQSRLDELLNGTRPEQVAAQQAVVQQLTASIADLDVTLSKSTLTAPFDGIISARQVDEGVVVGAGQAVVRLVENAVPEARIGLPEDAASRLQPGQPVTVRLDADTYSATVKSILPEVDLDTRTQPVIFQLEPTALAGVNPGQTVRVELSETIAEGGFWIPTQALTQDIRGLWGVYGIVPTAENADTYEVQTRSVEILHEESDRVLVRGTLQVGDRIVATGVHRLVPSQPVNPIE